MKKNLMLLIVSGLVFSVSTPSYATFWKKNNNQRQQRYSWNFNWDNLKDPECDWHDFDLKDYLHNIDWKGGDFKWHCEKPGEDPVPEPATAGLAFMGLGALAFATRRRK